MSQLTLESLEQRIAALERGMAQWLQAQQQAVRFKDWRQAAGRFTPSDLSQEIDAEGQRIREADRRQAER